MGELLRKRVQERLDALGINPFEAERRANLTRGYVNDLLIGKKTTFREKALPAIAAALECDVDYLMGRSSASAASIEPPAPGLPLAGIAEAGAWRDASAEAGIGETIPIFPDPRFDRENQHLFLVRGDHAAGLRIPGGSVVIAVSDKAYRDGDVVVAKRSSANGASEISIRVLSAGALSARPAKGEIPSYPASEAEIIGRIVSATVLFGEAH